LGTASLKADKVQQSDGRWAIAVPKNQTVATLSFLETNRVLSPRSAAPVAGGKGGFVPSREEQWFRYERSVALSIEDSLSAVLGVLEARVHLNLPETDPLFGTRKESIGSGSVLLVIDESYASKDEDIAALVAGAAGIPAAKVTVLKSRTEVVVVNEEQGEPSGVAVPLAEQVPAQAQTHAAHVWSFSGAELSIASCVMVTLLGAGVIARQRKRKRVRFPLPVPTDHED
jgi:type III secretion protein J